MGSSSFVRVMMGLFNLLILAAGVSLAATGIWVSVDGGPFLHVLKIFSMDVLHSFNVTFFFIAVGGVLVLLGLLGSCAARKESKCLLIMFFSILLVVFMSELTAAVIVLTFSPLAESTLQAWVLPVLQLQYGQDSAVTDLWEMTMTKLQCCGFTSYADFSGSYYYNKHGGVFPPSCCNQTESICDMANALNSAVKGCCGWLVLTLQKKLFIVGGVAAGVSVLKLAAMTVSVYLYCYIDKENS